ncbi:MAG: hypothetical protein J0L75_07630 [Spirochaetes bacterium]|nr:hypothetical protein [Spirochaetota bacterium]
MDDARLKAALSLLDDEAPAVRQELSRALAQLGEALESRARPHLASLSPEAGRQFQIILRGARREQFLGTWFSWLGEMGELARLEKAMTGLAWLASGPSALALPERLDALAEEFRRERLSASPESVVDFLFRLKGLRGAESDYHHPDHSNLMRVLESRRGLPLALTLIAILVCDRLGFTLQGLPTPRHFYATAVWSGQVLVFDCFRGGRLLGPAEINEICLTLPEGRRSLARGAGAWEMVARTLRNLARSGEEQGDAEEQRFYLELEKEIHAAK